jgi:pimeloyl-ACP methyl ester carboxylesterase
MSRKLLGALGVVIAVLVSSLAGSGPAGAQGQRDAPPRPVIFVHGSTGSGAQFETQALRLTSNGYPADRIAVHEYDSTFGTNTMEQVWEGLDQLITELLDETGADGVDLLGHSLGTAVSQGYLNSSAERAARVAHYVNIDGRTAAAPPGGVDTLAVWGEGDQARQIAGARNYYAPGQSHVQVATSAETFAQIYEFFTGRAPKTTDVVPEHGRIRLSGEANVFPQNQGADGFTLRIFEIDRRTGEREHRRHDATFAIGPDGGWGPFKAHAGESYEFALTRTDGSVHHLYFQPFLRSDHLVRLLTSRPGEGLDLLREPSDTSAGFGVIRYKEMWGDQGANNDTLEIDGVNILNPATAPRTKRVNATFVGDDNLDGVTDLSAPVQPWFSLPFISAVDLVVPAATPPDDTVRVEMVARAEHASRSHGRSGRGDEEVVNIPNWATSQNIVTIMFRDFQQ